MSAADAVPALGLLSGSRSKLIRGLVLPLYDGGPGDP